jgi:hypothetical protein
LLEVKDSDFKLDVRLTAEQVAERISSVLDKDGFFLIIPRGDKPLIGKVRGSTFCVRKRKDYANSWSPLLFGGIEPVDSGCIIKGKFRLHAFVRIFTIIWFGMIFFFVAIGIMTAFMESLKDKFDPKTLLVVFVPMMLIIGYVYLARWGKKQGEQEADGIREIMRELFKDVLSNK